VELARVSAHEDHSILSNSSQPAGNRICLSGVDPVPLSEVGTHLCASLGSKGKNRNSLACLSNAGSYSAESYCKYSLLTIPFSKIQPCETPAAAIVAPYTTNSWGNEEDAVVVNPVGLPGVCVRVPAYVWREWASPLLPQTILRTQRRLHRQDAIAGRTLFSH
jgi:hypothetical protein